MSLGGSSAEDVGVGPPPLVAPPVSAATLAADSSACGAAACGSAATRAESHNQGGGVAGGGGDGIAEAGREKGEGSSCAQQLCAVCVPFNSQCEHHMLPFYGTASIVFLEAPHLQSPGSNFPPCTSVGGAGDGVGVSGALDSTLNLQGDGVGAQTQTHVEQVLGGSGHGACNAVDREVQAQTAGGGKLVGPPSSHSTRSADVAKNSSDSGVQGSTQTYRRASAREQLAIESIVGMYTQRLQVQERITHQVADAVAAELGAAAVVVMVEAAHMCMVARGVENHAGRTTTVACRGLAVRDGALCHQALLASRQRSRPRR